MLKNVLYVLGVVFILIGILGFFNNPILGIFQVDAVHNVVHLLSGVLALAFAGKPSQAKMFAIVFGIVYGLVAVLGFMVASGDKVLGLVTVNAADNWLHVIITLVLLVLGFSAKSSGSSASSM